MSPRQRRILAVLSERGAVSRADVRRLLPGDDPDCVATDLANLRCLGYVVKHGAQRSNLWSRSTFGRIRDMEKL
jgi:predicted HTH transcriptional regulator